MRPGCEILHMMTPNSGESKRDLDPGCASLLIFGLVAVHHQNLGLS